MPVHGGRRRQMIGHVDAHAITLHRLNHRAGCVAVVPPALRHKPGREFMWHDFGGEMKDLHAINDAKGQRTAIGHDDRRVVKTRSAWGECFAAEGRAPR